MRISDIIGLTESAQPKPEYVQEWPFLKAHTDKYKQRAEEGNKAQLGIPADASLAQLDKIRSSKTASKAKKQRAHWLANMRRGNKK